MKRIKILVDRLEISDSSLVLGLTLQAVKLSFEEAMNFVDRFHSFEEMKNFYGANKVLREGEQYNGYIAVYYGFRSDVVSMYGFLKKRTDARYADYDMKRQIKEGLVYDCICRGKTGEFGGKFKYVWTFCGCRFEEWATELQARGYLKGESAKALSETLKRKLTGAAISGEIFELTESEDYLLRTYLGEYYDRFFITF